MYILGITGSIGSGKSTVAARFAELGAFVSHSDQVAHRILEEDTEVREALLAHFGDSILGTDGQINRPALANKAFASPEDQIFLNHVIHPRVKHITQELMDEQRAVGCKLFIIDAPLLFEAHSDSITDSVLVVHAKRIFREGRVERRSKITKVDFDRRESLQMPTEEKIRRADHVIDNDGSLEDLYSKVMALYEELDL